MRGCFPHAVVGGAFEPAVPAPCAQPRVDAARGVGEDHGQVGAVDAAVEFPHGGCGNGVEALQDQGGGEIAVAEDEVAGVERGQDFGGELVVAVGGAQARQGHALVGVGPMARDLPELPARRLCRGVHDHALVDQGGGE
jgi:hypothetical protein